MLIQGMIEENWIEKLLITISGELTPITLLLLQIYQGQKILALHYNQLSIMAPLPSPSPFLLLCLVAFISLCSCKTFSSNVAIPYFRREGCWMFLDRMHLEPGSLRLNFMIKLVANTYKENSLYQMQLVAIPDEIWQLSIEKKCEKHQFTQEEAKRVSSTQFVIHADLHAGNGYSFESVSTVEVPKDDTYHFVLRHCSKTVLAHGYGRDVKFEVMLDARNNDKMHSSIESAYIWLLPLLVLLGGCMLVFLYKNKEDEGDNWIKWTLKISLWVSISSIVVKYIGFIIYAYVNGAEYQFFDFFFMLLHSVSDSAIIVILLLLAYGWTVTFKNSMDFDLYVPLACMLGMVNVIMTLLNKVTDGQPDKYHMFDTIPAYIMVGFRLLSFAIFIVGIIKVALNINSQEKTIRRFILELAIIGTIYLTFLPASIYLVEYIDARYRKEVMYIGIEVVRYALNVWLVVLSGWKSSTYRKIIDKSFMEKGEKYY